MKNVFSLLKIAFCTLFSGLQSKNSIFEAMHLFSKLLSKYSKLASKMLCLFRSSIGNVQKAILRSENTFYYQNERQ